MKIVSLFPGYGSQFVGMAKELYDEYRVVQEYFEEASHCLEVNFVKLCFASSEVELGHAMHAYTASFLVSSSLHALLAQKGIVPTAIAGFNQGEIGALCAAKSFPFPDGLYLLSKYASFYESFLSNNSSSITHIKGVSSRKLESLCKKISTLEGSVTIALYQDEHDHIVSGTPAAVDLMRKEALEEGAKVDDIAIEFGLHSPSMEAVMDQMRVYREKVDFNDTVANFISGATGKIINQGSQIKEYVVDSLGLPIHWDKVIHAIKDYDLIIQMAPGSTLIDQIKRHYPEKKSIAINKKADIEALEVLVATAHKGTGEHGII